MSTGTLDVLRAAREMNAVEWDALVDRSGSPVFYRHRVLSAYERSGLGGQRATAYLLARDPGGTPVGALPLYLLDGREIFAILGVRPPAGGAATDALISHFPHCYDTTAMLAAPSPEVLRGLRDAALAEASRLGARVCCLLNVPADGPLAALLAELPGARPVPSAARWYLDVPSYGGLDGLLATMARATRRTLRAAARRAEAAGARIELSDGSGEDAADVAALCAASAAKHGNNYYPEAAVRGFLAALGGHLTVLRVRLGGRTLAASVCFRDGGVLHTWAGGAVYPPELNWSPNHVLFHHELRLAFDLGVRRLECGRRNDEFKARHRLSRRELLAFVWEV
ncbi:GNAT family N-acetyltransferase [Sphaerisporangium aureirubrum]|uniref:GNAT family N-acetyltransferase n=1 Tax=Sphaerisporangium aureirubrum TaxID=1544736 RepID=A0ABW1NLB1_9ACTN